MGWDTKSIMIVLAAGLLGGGVFAAMDEAYEPKMVITERVSDGQVYYDSRIEELQEGLEELQSAESQRTNPQDSARLTRLEKQLAALTARVDALPQSDNAELRSLLTQLRALAAGEDPSQYPDFADLIDQIARQRAAESFLDQNGQPRPELQAAIDDVLADREAARFAKQVEVKRTRRDGYIRRSHDALLDRMGEGLSLNDSQREGIEGALRAYRAELIRIEFELEPLNTETKSEYYARSREAFDAAAQVYDAAVRAALSRDQLDVYESQSRKYDLTAPGYGTPGK